MISNLLVPACWAVASMIVGPGKENENEGVDGMSTQEVISEPYVVSDIFSLFFPKVDLDVRIKQLLVIFQEYSHNPL